MVLDTALYLVLVPEEVNRLQTAEASKKKEEEIEKHARLRKGERKKIWLI